MKRCVLGKTTPFHAVLKKKEKKKREKKRCRFEAALFLLLLPPDMQQGKRHFFVFFSLSLPFLPMCSATHLMMIFLSSRDPQATPPLATTVGVVAEVATGATCMRR
jgi:hypothetical protein